jgi:hypothetical protein
LHFLQLPVSFCPLSPNILHSTLSQTTSSSVLPLRSETKFYACTKLHAKLCFLYCDVDCTCSFCSYIVVSQFFVVFIINTTIITVINPGQILYRVCKGSSFPTVFKGVTTEAFFVSHFYLDVTARDTGNRLEEKATLCLSLPGLKLASVQLLLSYFCDWDWFFCSWWD